jgi:LacI family transcriptional regulator
VRANTRNAEQFGMAAKNNPTIRSLAKSLRLSPATVSDALRGTGRVDPQTAKRVSAAAEKVGYKINPLTTALMSDLRRSRATTFRGVIAAVDINEGPRFPHGPFPRQIVAGARQRANELGFQFEEFLAGLQALSLPRLDSILKSRGIHGIMLLPSWSSPDLSTLDWSNYAGVYTDNFIEKPRLHTVCSDHYRSMMDLLARLVARGYKRPGLMLETGRDERLLLRQSAAFRAFQESNSRVIEPVPILFAREPSQKEFSPWFKRHQPDVVLNHFDETIAWMEACGARLPDTHGYVCLNVIARTRPCAALDLQPRQLGARAVELLIGQLQRAEYGSPAWTTTTMLTASWLEGPSLRPA